MAVRLRLMRMGRKKKPFFRIVAVDSRKRRDGAYLDKLGHYNPKTNPPDIVLDEEKALSWLQKGAQPSDTVHSILSKKGVLIRFDLMKKGASQDEIDEEFKKRELLMKAAEKEIAKEVEKEVVKEVEKVEEEPVQEEKKPAEEPAPPTTEVAKEESKESEEKKPAEEPTLPTTEVAKEESKESEEKKPAEEPAPPTTEVAKEESKESEEKKAE